MGKRVNIKIPNETYNYIKWLSCKGNTSIKRMTDLLMCAGLSYAKSKPDEFYNGLLGYKWYLANKMDPGMLNNDGKKFFKECKSVFK